MEDQYFLSGEQYDLLAVDKPNKRRRRRPAQEAIAEQLRLVFTNTSDLILYQVASKLENSIGPELARAGLDALARLPGWTNAMIKFGVSAMSQVTRIEQAACATDGIPHEMAEIQLDLKQRQLALVGAEKELTTFLQELHTAHPAMRKQIKSAGQMVMKAAMARNVNDAAGLVHDAIEIARQDKGRIASITKMYRVPKETAQWLIQILVRV